MFLISLKVTTKQKLIVYIQKIKRKKSIYITMENYQFPKKTARENARNRGTTKQPVNN